MNDFVVGVIATRLGYSRANAAAIVEALSPDDCEQIEIAAKRSRSVTEIAAVIYRARLRNALPLPRAEYVAAKQAAEAEAKQHFETICREKYRRGRDRRTPMQTAGIRVVPSLEGNRE